IRSDEQIGRGQVGDRNARQLDESVVTGQSTIAIGVDIEIGIATEVKEGVMVRSDRTGNGIGRLEEICRIGRLKRDIDRVLGQARTGTNDGQNVENILCTIEVGNGDEAGLEIVDVTS